ncbi:MAG: cytochrome o ubiquinol oxidase subunit IV [Candidatus Microsaccharimonas sossegonensis]|uniref:Cytochrome o ubiquinol oxidase subunit IV n=1 Tax=Candidatus Microsaccharimonas sossegonensis TaxID=2506948 RepID=A0A4Q0AIC2_9BACT|nr:MAG: cytochrome o ubiquinol oxidase subunit IV [Candidatus Microsaccharimonas sossegonensis]
MTKPKLETRHDAVGYTSYVVGFILSIVATLTAYGFVVNRLLPKGMLIYFVIGVAVVQLIIQTVFFLHIGRGSRFKFIIFVFAMLIVFILAIGSVWIMNNLNSNMMQMTPDQMKAYMYENQGI